MRVYVKIEIGKHVRAAQRGRTTPNNGFNTVDRTEGIGDLLQKWRDYRFVHFWIEDQGPVNIDICYLRSAICRLPI